MQQLIISNNANHLTVQLLSQYSPLIVILRNDDMLIFNIFNTLGELQGLKRVKAIFQRCELIGSTLGWNSFST